MGTKVYLPKAAGWYDLYTGDFFEPGWLTRKVVMDIIPAFYRAGYIVPLKKRMRRSSTCMKLDPLTLSVYIDPATGSAKGRVYLDDYKTKAYQDGKSFLSVDLEYSNGKLFASSTTGELPAEIAAEVERVEIYGLTAAPTGATLKMGSKEHALTVPIARTHGSTTSAVVKVQPWIELSKGDWSLQIA